MCLLLLFFLSFNLRLEVWAWQSPSQPDWKTEGRAAAARRDWEQAVNAYRKAIEQAPHDPNLWVELAVALKSLGNFPEAIANFEEALRLNPRGERAALELGDAYRRVFNYDEARRVFESAHRDHPQSPAPLVSLGLLEIELQTYEAAIAHLQSAVRLARGDLAARNYLADAYRAKGDQQRALEQLRAVLARDPHNALALYLRASIFADRNENELALAEAEKVVKAEPLNREGQLLLGKIKLRLNQCAEAVTTLKPLLDSQNSTSEELYLLSRAYDCAGQEEQAQKTLARFEEASKADRSSSENKTQAEHLVKQANDLALRNQFAPALDLLRQAISKDPQSGAAYSQLAKIYFSQGQVEKAAEAVDHALQIRPYSPDFLYVKGKILGQEGKLDEALSAFRETALVNPRESDAYYEMGILYQKRGDPKSALAALKKAVELSPDDPDYRRALTEISASTDTKP